MARVISKWNNRIEDMHYSPTDFLVQVQETIREYQFPFVKLGGIYHGQGRGGKRIYLRVHHRRHYIDIGAAPHGPDFYVSFYMFEKDQSFLLSLLTVIWKLITGLFGILLPFIIPKQDSSIFWSNMKKGYDYSKVERSPDPFVSDQLTMFQQSITKVVRDVITDVTTYKGKRFPS